MKKLFKRIANVILYSLGIVLLAFVVFYMATVGDHKVAETIEHNDTIPYITFDDISLHIETFGADTSDVIIVLHGGPGNDARYLLPLKELADSFHVVFYDQRGCGLSPRVPAEKLSLATYLVDLNNMVDHFGQGKKVNIIGHSWGAMLASAYISKYPNKVDKIVLAEPGFLNPETAKLFSENTGNMSIDFTFPVIKHLAQTWFQSLHVDKIDDQARFDYFMEHFILTDQIKNHPMAGYFCNEETKLGKFPSWRFGAMAASIIPTQGMDEDGNQTTSFVDGIENFQNEVLFLAGECNTLIGPEYQKHNAKLFPKARLVSIQCRA